MQGRRRLQSIILFHNNIQNECPPYLCNKIKFKTDVHVHILNLIFKELISPPLHRTTFLGEVIRIYIFYIIIFQQYLNHWTLTYLRKKSSKHCIQLLQLTQRHQNHFDGTTPAPSGCTRTFVTFRKFIPTHTFATDSLKNSNFKNV